MGASWAQAYCGPPPSPDDVLGRWNFDPALLMGLFTLAFVWRLSPANTSEKRLQAGAMFVLAAAFISPLCAASASLFSARVLHHIVLISLAAPLLALSLQRLPAMPLTLAGALHAAAIWLWHAPTPYAWALQSYSAYWMMELTLLVTAILFWRSAFDRESSAVSAALGALAVSILTGMLGAVIAFASYPFYAPHFSTTAEWGLTPLEDQQLAGLTMWVLGAAPYLACAVYRISRVVRQQGPASWPG